MTVRATLIKTERGSVLISPINFTPQQLSEIRAQGEVIAVIEPNAYHNLWATEARSLFPRATLWSVPGYEKRHPNLNPDKILTRDPWPYEADLKLKLLEGAPKLNEVVFYHPKTSTLIVTDLLFNMKNPKGLLAPIMFRIMGAYKKLAVSNLWKRFTEDKDKFRASISEILKWDFNRLVMAHGSIIESQAKPKLESALKATGWF